MCVCVMMSSRVCAGEKKSYEEQLQQMLLDLSQGKEKNEEKPLPHMNQVKLQCVYITFTNIILQH